MNTSLQSLPCSLLPAYKEAVRVDWANTRLPEGQGGFAINPFDFYHSVSSVYSSRIEGVDIDMDSFIKHKFGNVSYLPDYTRKTDDLYAAYRFARQHPLSYANAMEVHKLLGKHLLPPAARGVLRRSPMFVVDEKERIAYVACAPQEVEAEMAALFRDIGQLLLAPMGMEEVFYYAAFIHLMFAKIHPVQDGNGRLARLIEKWFVASKLGQDFWGMKSEKYYYTHLHEYHHHLAVVGLEFEKLDWGKSIPFLSLLPHSISFE